MPTYYPDFPLAPPELGGGSALTHIEAIRDYLFLTIGNGQRAPDITEDD